jgi:putrescine transport system substrate-binding protein
MTGLAIDPSILAALGPEAPADSWSLLFDPAWVSRFAGCGVALLDAPEEALAAALLWLGRDPNSTDPEDVAAGLSALAEIAPYVSHFTSEQLDLMRDGEVCLALSWNSDVTETEGAFTFVVPREGGLMWVDLFVIPVDSENPEGARRFVEFMLRPEISALNTNETFTANAVRAAQALTDPALLADEAVHPSPEKKERLHVLLGREAAEKREILRHWIRIKLRGHR